MQSFFDSCLLLHHKILIVLEEALFMHSNELVSLCSAGNGEVRITHYPPLPISALKTGNKFRIAEHTDVGVLTLLFQDSVGGLEVEDQKSLAAGKDGKFIPVESKNLGEMIVNCGDTLQMWSADLLRSANHRVTYNRDLDADEREDVIIPSRYSVGFFGKANPEASIDPIAGLIGKGVKKEAVEGKGKTAQEYYNFMHEKTYS
jgi:isopenicillin N synthase-like dioxygenase